MTLVHCLVASRTLLLHVHVHPHSHSHSILYLHIYVHVFFLLFFCFVHLHVQKQSPCVCDGIWWPTRCKVPPVVGPQERCKVNREDMQAAALSFYRMFVSPEW